MNSYDEQIKARFDTYTFPVTESGCYLWVGGYFSNGYGQFRVGAKKKKAHRVAWTLTYGRIPDNKQVLHKCDVKACVRPEHLFLGTHADNMSDMVIKGRSNKLNGVACPWAKLTIQQVEAIRKDKRLQKITAAEHNVSRATVCLIQKGNRWKILAVNPEEPKP